MYKYNKKYLALIVTTLFLVVFLLSGQLTTGIFDNIKIALEKLVLFASLLLILSPFLFWGFGIYYCVKVAIRLNKNILIAFLIGAFLPVISIIIYYYFSFKNKKRKIKIKIIKIASSVIFLLLFISGGISYYFMGTPDSSLYSLREAIIRNDNAEFEKYFDIKSVAEKSGRSTFQIQEKINSLNDSIIEFKEENPDKNKDAIFYIPVELTGKEIKTATISYSQDSDWLSVTFNEQGKKLFSEITKKILANK